MSAFFHAVEVFFDHLTAVHFGALGIAIALHVLKIVARAFAWRNVLRAAFPDSRVKHRVVFGAYFAGVGLNSIAPARTGDALKVYLAKRGIEGSNYATLASSLFVETLFDIVVASTLLIWALQLGVLPSLDVLPSIPDVEWGWAVRNPRLAILIGTVLFFVAVVVAFSAADRIKDFRHRLANGFAILGNWRRYLTEVVSWQALSWGFRFAAVWWFLKAFDIPATLHNTALVLVVQSLSTLLPISPGGAGTQQGLTAYVLRGKAGSTTALLSFSVGMNIATIVTNVVIGALAVLLTLRTLRWRRHMRAHEPVPEITRVERQRRR
ncbi:MAG: lysylphosphatidylglycerol synthase transmembrane domain-containing protein [Gaiellaceae bacterium]